MLDVEKYDVGCGQVQSVRTQGIGVEAFEQTTQDD